MFHSTYSTYIVITYMFCRWRTAHVSKKDICIMSLKELKARGYTILDKDISVPSPLKKVNDEEDDSDEEEEVKPAPKKKSGKKVVVA